MIRVLAAVAMLVASVLGFQQGNVDAGIAALAGSLTFLVWAGERADWTFGRRRRVDGIPATRPVRCVLTVLLSDASGLSIWPISRLSGVRSGAVYLCLDRLEMARWIRGEWETPEPLNRPRRRFYRLTPGGRAHALDLLGLTEWTEQTQ